MKPFFKSVIIFSFLLVLSQTVLALGTSIETKCTFVANNGQFDHLNWKSSPVKYALKQNNLHVLLTSKGLVYRFDQLIRNPHKNSSKKIAVSELIYANWVGCNNDVKIIASEKAPHYYSYAVKDYITKELKNINHINGYQKITYKNLYDNIDVEYFIHPDGGIKYNVLLHPGADPSVVQLKYTSEHTHLTKEKVSIQLNTKQQVEIHTSLGEITELQPITYYQDNRTPISSNYHFENNILSFQLTNYDNSKEVVIDPWITSPSFNGSSAAWGVETDAYGNIYTTGGEMPMELKKYNSAGALQWTYSTPFDTVGTWLGTLKCDRKGNSYITQGSLAEMEKIDSSGNMVWHVNDTSSVGTEYWSITFNDDTTMLVVGGTSQYDSPLRFYSSIFNIDVVNGDFISKFDFAFNNSFLPPNAPEEVRSINIAPNQQIVYLSHDSIGSIDQDFDTHPTTARTFQVNNQHHFSYQNQNFFPSHQNGSPLSALAVNNHFIYTHFGDSICQWDLNTGALINQVALPGGTSQTDVNGELIVENAGMDVDSCNNVYVGSMNQVIKFDENLNVLAQATVPFIVHDVSVNNNTEVIAVGAEFNNSNTIRNGKIESIDLLSACPQFDLKLGLPTQLAEQNEQLKDFSVSPNPFNQQFEVQYEHYDHQPTLNVYNVAGQLIYSQVMHSFLTRVNLANQPSGIYFIQLSDPFTAEFKKVKVMKE